MLHDPGLEVVPPLLALLGAGLEHVGGWVAGAALPQLLLVEAAEEGLEREKERKKQVMIKVCSVYKKTRSVQV